MNVILYSTGCPKCNILKTKLNQKNIAYIVNNDIDYMLSRGFNAVPVLEVDGVTMHFEDAIKWVNSW